MWSKKQNKYSKLSYFVTQDNLSPILGLHACIEMDIIRKVDAMKQEELLEELESAFSQLGYLPRKQKLVLKPDAKPVIHAPRRVAESLKEPLKSELDKMLKMGDIAKETEPTEWVSLLVIVHKGNG